MAHALQPSSGAPETTPALVVSAPVGLVLAANGAFCAHTGYVENDILGRPLHTLQPMRMSGSLIAALQAQQAGSGFSVHEVPLRLRNGAEERATIRASPLYCIETGALQGFSLLVLASSRERAPSLLGRELQLGELARRRGRGSFYHHLVLFGSLLDLAEGRAARRDARRALLVCLVWRKQRRLCVGRKDAEL